MDKVVYWMIHIIMMCSLLSSRYRTLELISLGLPSEEDEGEISTQKNFIMAIGGLVGLNHTKRSCTRMGF